MREYKVEYPKDTLLDLACVCRPTDDDDLLCEIENREVRDLVPYSFRHYFITDMINKAASPTQVAETCGTSTAQIEKIYYHTTERKMIENAMPQYYYKDGLLIPK